MSHSDSKKRSLTDFFGRPKATAAASPSPSASPSPPPAKKTKHDVVDEEENSDPFAFDVDDDAEPVAPSSFSPTKKKVVTPVSTPIKQSNVLTNPAAAASPKKIETTREPIEIDQDQEDDDDIDMTQPANARTPLSLSTPNTTKQKKKADVEESNQRQREREREKEKEKEQREKEKREKEKHDKEKKELALKSADRARRDSSAGAGGGVASSASGKKAASSAPVGSRKKKQDAAQKAAADLAEKISPDVDHVMAKVASLRQLMVADSARHAADGTRALTLADLNLPHVKTEVLSLNEDEVRATIERVVTTCVQSIISGHGFQYEVPVRSSANQLYVPELDRIVLKDKLAERMFASLKNGRKTALTTRILGLVYELCLKKIHVTKRDLFYSDVKLFEKQEQSDDVIEDVAFVASEKGIVVGRISFKDDGDPIDCTRMGVGGKAIPPSIDRITDIKGDAKFILLVEKDAAFMRLAEDRFYHKYPCCIITAKGQPDVATRLFLKKVKETLNIPVLGLVDADPYGLKILSVYMSGSKNMSYDSASLTTPDIKWLGVRPSDLDKYKIPEQCRLDMSDHDIKTGKELLEEEFIQKNPDWVRELKLMIETKKKAEIQALSSFGFQYLSNVYLPLKLQHGGWI